MGNRMAIFEESNLKISNSANMVFRQVCTYGGYEIGLVGAPYDGTPEDAIRVAKTISEQMFNEYQEASNGESLIRVTDESGNPKWKISPNFRHIIETGLPPTSFEKSLIDEGLMVAWN